MLKREFCKIIASLSRFVSGLVDKKFKSKLHSRDWLASNAEVKISG
jgi:hypothetical protein